MFGNLFFFFFRFCVWLSLLAVIRGDAGRFFELCVAANLLSCELCDLMFSIDRV